MNKIYIDKLSATHKKEQIISDLFINNSLEVEFIYKSTFENTKDLRDFVEVICSLLNFTDKLKGRVILISDELNNNAIEYGTSSNGFNILRIRTYILDGVIDFNLEVQDSGDGRAPKKALDMETMRAHKLRLGYFGHNSIRGRGLFLIIVKLVDRLYFKNSIDGGLIVGIKVKI